MSAPGRISVTRSGLAATLLVFAVAAACIRLGFWQLDRLAERRQHNEQLAGRMGRPAVVLKAAPPDTTGWLYRRVMVRGRYDVERTIVLPARYLGGMPGVHVVTPLRLASGEAVLVNRGWLPAADGINADPAAFLYAGPVELHGIVLPFFGPESSLGRRDAGAQAASGSAARAARAGADAQGMPESAARDSFRRVWFAMDETALRAQFPYPLGPVHILALRPEGGAAGPRPLAAPSPSSGRHLSYAIQWFSFAAIALAGWAALLRQAARTRGPRAPTQRTTSAVKGQT